VIRENVMLVVRDFNRILDALADKGERPNPSTFNPKP